MNNCRSNSIQNICWCLSILLYSLAFAAQIAWGLPSYQELQSKADGCDADAKGVLSVLIQISYLQPPEGRLQSEEALRLANESAEQGSPFGQYALGRIFEVGFGAEKDIEKSKKFYSDAFSGLMKVAESGDAHGQWLIGVCYDAGRGVAKDEEEAVKWYRKAAEQGVAEARYNLGICYANGQGVAKDDAEAAKWFRKAAEQGVAEAQHNLGICHANGQGVAKDEAEAVKWYRKAAEQGDAVAQFDLGVCYEKGRGAAKDKAEAVKWFRKAAEQGDADAQNNLGVCYANGRGVAKDEAEAVKWYRKAAEQGNKIAMNNLAHADESLSNSKKNLWLYKAAEADSELHGGPDTEDVLKLTVDGKLHGANQPPKGLFALIKDSLFGDIKNKRLDEIKRSAPKDIGGKQVYPIRLVFRTPNGGVERWDLRFYKDDFGQWSVESGIP